MFEEALEFMFGPIGIAVAAGALLLGTERGRETARKATREVVKGGLVATEALKDWSARAQESLSDIVAEAQAELHNGHKGVEAITNSGQKKSRKHTEHAGN